jgi:hypothetical protein
MPPQAALGSSCHPALLRLSGGHKPSLLSCCPARPHKQNARALMPPRGAAPKQRPQAKPAPLLPRRPMRVRLLA